MFAMFTLLIPDLNFSIYFILNTVCVLLNMSAKTLELIVCKAGCYNIGSNILRLLQF